MPSNETEEFEFRARAEREAAQKEPAAPKNRTVVQELLHQGGITGRNAMEAVGSLPAALGNTMEYLGVKGAGGNLGTTVADKLGLPTPESGIEKFGNEMTRTMVPGIAGYGAGAKLVSKLPHAMKTGKLAAFIEPTVGGAGAGAVTAASENQDPVMGAATGAIMGPAGKAVGDVGGWAINKGRRIFENASTQATRRVQELAGPGAAQQAALLRSLRGDVQGELPTSGMAATVDPKMAYQKELQEQARRRLPGEYTERDLVNEAARMHDLERIAATGRQGTATQGGPVPMSANEGRRAARTDPLYAAAMPERVTMTPELEELVAGIETRPAVVRGGRAFRQEQTNATVGGGRVPQGPVPAIPATPAMPEVRNSMGVVIKPAVPEVPGVPGHRSVQDLQQVQKELDARIRRLSMSDPEEAHRLSVARGQLTHAMMEQSPNFSAATNTFRQFSQPQNQSEIAQVLASALRGANGKERVTSFLNARQNAPQTLKRADQSPRFEQIEQVMTPTQMRQINAVTNSLRRQAAYENIGRSSIPEVKSGAEAVEQLAPSLISRGVSWTKKGLSHLGMKSDVDINRIIDQATLHPDRMAQLLEQAAPSDRIKILSAIREANPKGASIGIVTGEEQ